MLCRPTESWFFGLLCKGKRKKMVKQVKHEQKNMVFYLKAWPQVLRKKKNMERLNCRPLALRDHVTNASFKQWLGILLMTKIDRAHKNYLTPEIWEETYLRAEIFYGTLIFQLALRDHVTNASFKQWLGILLMTKIDRAHKNYLTPEIWEETYLRAEIFYGTLIFQLALRDHVTNASFKQWLGILLMTKTDRAHKNYLTHEIWEETYLRAEIFYGTLIFQHSRYDFLAAMLEGKLLPSI